MAHLIAVLLFVFVTNYAATDAIALDCTYKMYYVPVLDGNLYTCNARPLTDHNDTVSAVYGEHHTGKGHLDVEGIYIAGQNLPFFPRNMEEFFPNLLAISLINNSITSISNSHLIAFPYLRHLSLKTNKISTLDNNVFSGMWSTSTSYYISFYENIIEHVGDDINIPNSGAIDFRRNTCINERATTPDEISILKLNLLPNCPPKISQIQDSLGSSPNLLTQQENRNTELQTRNTELENRNTELENRKTELETRISQLENGSNNWKRLETIVAFLKALMEDNVSLKIEHGTSKS